jgi:hypothetical protein
MVLKGEREYSDALKERLAVDEGAKANDKTSRSSRAASLWEAVSKLAARVDTVLKCFEKGACAEVHVELTSKPCALALRILHFEKTQLHPPEKLPAGVCCTGCASADELSSDNWKAIRERNKSSKDHSPWTVKQSLLDACKLEGLQSATKSELQPMSKASSILQSFSTRNASQVTSIPDQEEVESPEKPIALIGKTTGGPQKPLSLSGDATADEEHVRLSSCLSSRSDQS